jgi:hypothetical protein
LLIKSFSGAGIINKIIALFDNDTAVTSAIQSIKTIKLPKNIMIKQYNETKIVKVSKYGYMVFEMFSQLDKINSVVESSRYNRLRFFCSSVPSAIFQDTHLQCTIYQSVQWKK